MAKSKAQLAKANKKRQQMINNKRRSNGSNGNSRRPGLLIEAQSRIGRHINMLLDPCQAVIGPTAYRGSDGFVNRFNVVSSITSSAGTNTAWVMAFYPAYNGIWAGAVADALTPVTPSWITPGPGQTFLNNTADSQRAVAACIKAEYAGTELNRQGVIYSGVLPVSALTGTTTLLQLQNLCQAVERTPDHMMEVKWVPTSIEETYWENGVGTPSDTGDRNAIIFIGSGFTQGIVHNFQTTLVAEWRPMWGQGFMQPTPNTPDAPAGLERVREVLSTMGNWYVEGVRTAAAAIAVGAQAARATRSISRMRNLITA